ncbi:MAG: type VI secretion system-associated FHA domain protein TagH [Arcobacter sp.]|nr:MAG: type VI secretion system-associated FHA domain protein TagH [Arcobacter sp.]
MKLVFDIVKNGKNIPSKRNFHFEENGGTIGRNGDNDWVLNDPNSYISGTHVQILCKHGTFFIKDESTNGTYLKSPYKKLPKGHPVKINASDVFIIGDHELQARFSNNDYNQDDLISSIAPSVATNDDNIIPNDDFLFDMNNKGFTSVDSQTPTDMDIMSILETPSAPPVHNFQESSSYQDESAFIDVVLEDKAEVKDDIDVASFFSEPAAEPMQESIPEVNETVFEEHISIPAYVQPEVQEEPLRQPPTLRAHGLEGSISILESKLGIKINALKQEDRDTLMAELGDIIINTLDALQNSIQLKDKTKQDLHLSTNHLDVNDNNPIKLGSAATKLLEDKDKSTMLGMMSISEGIRISFNEIDSHCIALHSSSKNIMKIAATKFSPKNLEYRFESSGALRGVLPKQQLLWKAYSDMFDVLNERPQEGVDMIRDDFTKEYENISYSLKLGSANTRKRV